MQRLYNFLLLNKKLAKEILLGLSIFIILRLVFIFRFGNLNTFIEYSEDIPLMIFNILRFDLQSLMYIFSIILLLNLISLFFKSEKIIRIINKISTFLIPILLIISILILIADHEFYSFFKLHFNPVAFDFFDEEPKLLLRSIWIEHPVIWILSSTLVLFLIIRYFTKRFYSNTNLKNKKLGLFKGISISITFLSLYFILMRGSLGTFPLEIEDITVSENEFINSCVPNGLFSLKEAYAETKREFKIDKPNQVLKKYGYESFEHAYYDYTGIHIDSIKNKNIEELIYKSSNNNKTNKKYNVVFLLMESMSNHFLNYHSKENNLLGKLESHFNDDIVFRNFQSSGNRTISTIENIILNTPYHPLFSTKYRYNTYEMSIAKPFKDAGYNTSFITGIELGWRHLNEVIKRQYFDVVTGKNGILRNNPNAKANKTWGIYDHCMLDYIYDQLVNSDTSMFIMSLSSTNHTPYEIPKNYKPYKIDPSIANKPEFSVTEERYAIALTAFQYSNDALGRFMNKIKESSLAENTIVIITGDHNIRSILSYNTQELMPMKYSVPLYLYIPEEIKKDLHIDTERWGSHYDIMTSIYPLILNNVRYPNLGQNLFDEKIPSDQFYSLNDAQLLHDKSLNSEDINKKTNARKTILKYYYSSIIHSFNK